MTKTKRIISIALMAVPAVVLLMGGVMKLVDAEPDSVMDFLNKAGFEGSVKLLGIAGLVCAALFIWPKTHKIGFLLASCYFSGALAIELAGGMSPLSAVFLVLMWIGMFLGNKEVFLTEKTVSRDNAGR